MTAIAFLKNKQMPFKEQANIFLKNQGMHFYEKHAIQDKHTIIVKHDMQWQMKNVFKLEVKANEKTV